MIGRRLELVHSASNDPIKFVAGLKHNVQDPIRRRQNRLVSVPMAGQINGADRDSGPHQPEVSPGIQFLPCGAAMQPDEEGGRLRHDPLGGYEHHRNTADVITSGLRPER